MNTKLNPLREINLDALNAKQHKQNKSPFPESFNFKGKSFIYYDPTTTIKTVEKLKKIYDKTIKNIESDIKEENKRKTMNETMNDLKEITMNDLEAIDGKLSDLYQSSKIKKYVKDYDNLTEDIAKCGDMLSDFENAMNKFLNNPKDKTFNIQDSSTSVNSSPKK